MPKPKVVEDAWVADAEPVSATPFNKCLAKIVKIMAATGDVPKSGHNDFHNYSYVTEADAVESVRKALVENGVVFVLDVEDYLPVRERQTSKGTSYLTTLVCRASFVDSDSGDTVSYRVIGVGDDPADKGVYKAMTGAKKYALTVGLLLVAGNDPEGDTSTDKRENVAVPAARPASQPASRPASRPAAPAPPQQGGQRELPPPSDATNDLFAALREAADAKAISHVVLQRSDAGKQARALILSETVGRRVRGIPDLSEDEKVTAAQVLRRRVELKGSPLGEAASEWTPVADGRDNDIPF